MAKPLCYYLSNNFVFHWVSLFDNLWYHCFIVWHGISCNMSFLSLPYICLVSFLKLFLKICQEKNVFFQYVGYGVYNVRVQNQLDFIKFGGMYLLHFLKLCLTLGNPSATYVNLLNSAISPKHIHCLIKSS